MAPDKPEQLPSKTPQPVIEERFVVKPRFSGKGGTKTIRMLNADGHIDAAHRMGLISLTTEIIDRWNEDTNQTNEENETFVSRTRWCIVRATAVVFAPGGGSITATGISCTSDRDKFVKQPGHEVAVAETRAKKRALADACNITERFISPDNTEPTRETVDMPLPKDEDKDNEKPGIPQDMLRKPDITPPIEWIKARESGGQFDV